MKKFFKNNKGFTLIELLVVIAILAVLATLYIPRIINSTADAKRTVAISNARTLASEIYMNNATNTTKIGTSGTQIKNLSDGDVPNLSDADLTALKSKLSMKLFMLL